VLGGIVVGGYAGYTEVRIDGYVIQTSPEEEWSLLPGRLRGHAVSASTRLREMEIECRIRRHMEDFHNEVKMILYNKGEIGSEYARTCMKVIQEYQAAAKLRANGT